MKKRIVKIPMPIDLIRRMDEALSAGRGGLETREEFIREASEGLLAEVSYAEAPPEPVLASARGDQGPSVRPRHVPAAEAPDVSPLTSKILDSVPPWEQEELRLSDLAGSGLDPPRPGATIESGVADPEDEPLLGIHNRDYPSLWAAGRLARYTAHGLVSLEDFYSRATRAAWYYGWQLRALEERLETSRLTPLFPTNSQKPDAAERAFRNFAIGSIPRRPSLEGTITAGGPLFVWRMCQLRRENGELMVGITLPGRLLLEGLTGVSLETPHSQAAANLFLRHLIEQAPGERWGFERILAAALAQSDREKLVSRISEARPDWSAATASSIAQGYVARAREWGLLEPRLQRGRYRLTEFGEKWQQRLVEQGDGIDPGQETQS